MSWISTYISIRYTCIMYMQYIRIFIIIIVTVIMLLIKSKSKGYEQMFIL